MIKDYQYIAEISNKNPSNFVGNPINSFLLIKKLTKDLDELTNTMKKYNKSN
jgi:hypothetical protein